MKFDYLVVGAGFSGSVIAEQIASQMNKKVILIDSRAHTGGNAHDFYDEHGVLVHKYGPHIFHTNSKKVWDYLSKFTEWRTYYHHVLAVIEGKKVPVPFNLNSLNALFPHTRATEIEGELVRQYGTGARIPILKLRESASKELRSLSEFVYEKVFSGYTLKQWGLKPEQLSPSVTARVPVSVSRDDRYFQDTYQAMPKDGYHELFNSLLGHKNIQILLNTSLKEAATSVKFDKLVYTGPLDDYFDFVHGELPYRSLRFELKFQVCSRFQEVGTVNYPNENLFTRITEFKHLTGQEISGTVTATEYPQAYKRGENIPYYPIPGGENADVIAKYQREVEKLKGSTFFLGRLADYMYYNMDQAVARALNVFEKEIAGNG